MHVCAHTHTHTHMYKNTCIHIIYCNLDNIIVWLYSHLDEDNNGEITEEEFVALPPGELDGAFMDSDRIWQSERRKEFRNVIDMNKDGKVTRLELKVCIFLFFLCIC